MLVAASFGAAFPTAALGQDDVPNLTPTPQTPSTPEPEPAPAPAPEMPSAGPTAELPNTGADPRLLALAGAALLLTGTGLRLRTLDERF